MRHVGMLIVALSGCGPSSFEDFRNQLTEASCERDVRCGVVGASEKARCAPPVEALAIVQPGASADLSAAVKAGRMRFNSGGAQACIDAMKGATCEPAEAARRFELHCHNVVQPKVAVNQGCLGAGECEGGTCVQATPGSPGRCIGHPPPGARCVPMNGRPEETCDPTVQFCGSAGADPDTGPVCTRHRQRGQACATDDECSFGLVCLGTCGDPPKPPRGAPCTAIGTLCDVGVTCDTTGTCTAQRRAGEACDTPSACEKGLACVGLSVDSSGNTTSGACRAWLDLGGACANAQISGCPASQRCETGTCASGPTPPRAGHRSPCSAAQPCHARLYCDAVLCQYLVGQGGDCTTTPDACAPGLVCHSASKTCE